jgi:PhzF family phenazine biosynthesis protein
MTTALPMYQVDAFASQVFEGNPAAVCPLEHWLSDEVLQNIAAENNLSETAFFVPVNDGRHDFHLRWFTPVEEVDLCGHATLAAAFVIDQKLHFKGEAIRFTSRSGTLTVHPQADEYTLDFPEWPLENVSDWQEISACLGVKPKEVYRSHDWLVVLERAEEVLRLAPDFAKMKQLEARGLIVTAPGSGEIDCVSRAFFPKLGIEEDPVTGSAHCAIAPYWWRRLAVKKPSISGSFLGA